MRTKLRSALLLVIGGVAASIAAEQMTVGTNAWVISWGGTSTDPFINGYTNVTGSNPWRPEFIQEVSAYTAFRFIEYVGLNSGEDPATWAARTPKSAQRQWPVAFEWMIDLCNRTGVDMWLNIPHQWDQDLPGCRSLAQLVYTTLDPSLRVYVEYANENWNTSYFQNYCRQQGAAAGLGDASLQTTGDRYSALASAKIWEQFEAVFGKGNPRLIRTLCGWVANTSTCGAQIGLLRDTTRNPQRTMPDLYCVAPYIGPCSTSQVPALTAAVAADLRAHRTLLARAGGIPLGGYEGGFSNCNHTAIASDPAAYNAMMLYLDTLNVYFQGVYNNYNHSGSSWGAKLFIGQDTNQAPIYRALADWNVAHPRAVVSVSPAGPSSRKIVAVGRTGASTRMYALDGRQLSAMTSQSTGTASVIQVGEDGSVRVVQTGRGTALRGRPDRGGRPERQ